MDLSIIIISWNVSALLEKCLRSLSVAEITRVGQDGQLYGSGPTTEVIVIDSASADDTVAMVKKHFPWVHLYPQSENIGFVRGNNFGLRYATGDSIMLLNPDTEVFPDTLPRLLDQLHSHDSIGVVGPHTLNTDGTHQSSRRRFPGLLTGIFESTWFEALAPQAVISQFRVEDQPDDGVYAVDWVQGHALLARAEVWQQVGALDERYIMFSEELDWCKRAKLAGWEVYYVGDAKLIHHGGQSTEQVKARSHIHFQHSKLRYFRKFHGWGAFLLIWMVLVFNYALQLVLEGAKWLIGHKRALRAERIHVYRRVLGSFFVGETIAMRKV